MSITERELNIVNKLVNCSAPIKSYTKRTNSDNGVYIEVKIEHQQQIKVNIIDDITNFPFGVVVTIDKADDIDNLHIVVDSGLYYDDRDYENYINKQLFYEGGNEDCTESAHIIFRCKNNIKKLRIQQEIHTEDTYSYYGNQVGFNPTTIQVVYDSEKYKNIEFEGIMSINSKNNYKRIEESEYNLRVIA